MKNRFSRLVFRCKHYIEGIFFLITRLGAIPAWVSYYLASPKYEQLTYKNLLELNQSYITTPKPSKTDTWKHQIKWANRAIEIAHLYNVKQVLEVGCGQGKATILLNKAGLDISTCDLVDILTEEVRKAKLKVSLADVCAGLPYSDATFELIFSINSLEHFDNPEKAISEMIRVLKPGGYLFLTFDPLYNSAWGLHASRRLGMPYPQLLFSNDTIERFVIENNAKILSTYSEGSDTSKIGPPLNRYPVDAYRNIFKENSHQLKMIFYTERTDLKGLHMIRRYPQLFKAYAPSFDNLIISGIKLLARRV